ncbi:MAG: hypothetical protein AAF587_07510 [Bacteroidota bacterium]
MNRIMFFCPLLLLILACGKEGPPTDKDPAAQPSVTSVAQSESVPVSNEKESTHMTAQHHRWDGFYFFDIGMGSIIVIYEGKYYNFERKDFRSFYKDFEYDIAFDLNEEGYIPIVRKYFLNRKDEIDSKETILFDTQPIADNGQTTGLQCRGYAYQRVPNFGAYIDLISATKADLIQDIKNNSAYQDDAIIQQALKDPDFIQKSRMTEAPLRHQTLEFWELVVHIIKANQSQ